MRVATATSLRRAWFAACALAVTVCAHALTSDAVHLTGAAPLMWLTVFAATTALGTHARVTQFRPWKAGRIAGLLIGTQLIAHLVLGAAPWLVGLTTAGHHHHTHSAAMIDGRSLVIHIVAATIIGLLLRSGQRRLVRLVRTVVHLVRLAFQRVTTRPAFRWAPFTGDVIPVVGRIGGALPTRGPPLAHPA